MLAIKKGSQRFTLLLLEENEIYVGNWVANCQWPLSSESTFQKANRLSGTLRLCSRSLFFEPDDIRLPIARYCSFRYLCSACMHTQEGKHETDRLQLAYFQVHQLRQCCCRTATPSQLA